MNPQNLTLGQLKEYLFGLEVLDLLKGLRDRHGPGEDITITITIGAKGEKPWSVAYTQKGEVK